MRTKQKVVSVILSFLVAGTFSVASVASQNTASNVNGKWYSSSGTIIDIHYDVARVSVSTSRPPCGGEFMANVVQRGTQVVLDSEQPHENGGVPFRVYFRIENGVLHEMKPYPSGAVDALAFWHGATCGFGLSEGGAVFDRKPSR